jgi:hypothetical protein
LVKSLHLKTIFIITHKIILVYVIQNYAEVSGNSHLSGSINGGLSISINGNNFGDDDDEVKVMIAGMYVKIIYTNDEGFLFCCLTYF